MKRKIAFTQISVTSLCTAISVLCAMLYNGKNVAFCYAALTLFPAAATAYCCIDGESHAHASRTMFVLIVSAAVATVCYLIYVKTGLSERFTDFEALKSFILGSGFWGVAVFVGLTVFQVVVLPIPEAVTILLGVAIYGATWSFVLSCIGTFLGSLISFMLGKVFGRRLCNWMFGAENTEKYAAILSEKGRFPFIVMLLFPAFPDDMLCMIAGITSMSYGYFTFVCLVTRPVMIGLTAYLGSGVIPFSGKGVPIWIAIGCLMFAAFVIISRFRTRAESAKSTGHGNRRTLF